MKTNSEISMEKKLRAEKYRLKKEYMKLRYNLDI